MEPLGVLLYGYSQDDSKALKIFLESIVSNEIIIITGSFKEKMKVIDILEKGPTNNFEDNKNKILVFLGFSEDQVGKVLDQFPKDESIKRPIFCGLTEQNINWTLEYLIEHLLEEDKYWTNKKMTESKP